MNRSFAAISVLTLSLVAVAVCMRQTLAYTDELGSVGVAFFVIEVTGAVALIASIAILLLRRVVRHRRTVKRQDFALVRPLRRLLSAVWS